jgi:hypothetical protein
VQVVEATDRISFLQEKLVIRLKDYSLALHSHDVPGYKYTMSQTWTMPQGARPSDLVYWILYARDHSPEFSLRNVVINCHGLSGKLYIGGDGQPTLNSNNLGIFSQLQNKEIGTIWLVACEIAKGFKGRYFCEQMAKTAGCNVVAADVSQHVDFTFYLRLCPSKCIDEFEGKTYWWDSSGACHAIGQDAAGVPGVAD